VFSAAPIHGQSSSPESISSGVGVRHGLLKFFSPDEQQTVVHEWDNKREQLVEAGLQSGRHKRRRTASNKGQSLNSGGVVVSQEYLKALDSELAPYSDDNQSAWSPLVSFVTPSTVARVVGFDDRGEARVDAVTASVADEHELKSAGGKQTWGKAREEAERRTAVDDENVEEGQDEDEDDLEELLHFINVDGKRSWPAGAVGEELTRWSKDKSWRLSDTVATLLGGGRYLRPATILAMTLLTDTTLR
jgi:A1 cistron-splicing factor AAR2